MIPKKTISSIQPKSAEYNHSVAEKEQQTETIERLVISLMEQKETIKLLANTLIEVKKHMTAHIPEKIFDMVNDTLSKVGLEK